LGFKGRIAIHEVLHISTEIKDAIADGKAHDTIHHLAKTTP
jgi:type II secretory ATPase GspE/PulE/Tfp pilus assembly ATPase PilB-like protein